MRGVRHELLEELQGDITSESAKPHEENQAMRQNDSNPTLIICVTALACVAMVSIVAIVYLQAGPRAGSVPVALTPQPLAEATETMTVDVTQLKSADNQPLILPDRPKTIPPRPAKPGALPKTDAGHWYDMEYAGWGVDKVNLPISPGDGPQGKKVTYLKAVDHPYQTAMVTGMQKVADAYGIDLRFKTANNDINIQSQQVDQVINERPDLVIISPVDAKACIPFSAN